MTSEMIDIKQCYLCGSGDYRVLYHSNLHEQKNIHKNSRFACTRVVFAKHGQIVQCINCGLVYNNPREDDGVLLNRYRCVQDEDYMDEVESRQATYSNMIVKIMDYVETGNLLDVGCYTGIFLNMAREKGFTVQGIEPSKWASDYVRTKLGIEVYTGSISEYNGTPRSFEVVTMWDVIEHLATPLQDLKSINRLLKPGGLLVFSTHNIESNAMKVLRSYYPFLVEMHVCHFSPQTLRYVLELSGFELHSIEKHIRISRLGYLVKKMENYSPFLANSIHGLLSRFNLTNKLISIGFLGLINVYARKVREINDINS